MLKEFRDFAMRGNVVDLAVGLIIGAAFGAIVTSMVGDVIMPVIGYLTGGMDFKDLAYWLKPKVLGPDGVTVVDPGVAIFYGKFINFIITFLIVAFAMFMLVKAMNQLIKKKVEAPSPPEPTPQEKLLTEIRDLLAKGR